MLTTRHSCAAPRQACLCRGPRPRRLPVPACCACAACKQVPADGRRPDCVEALHCSPSRASAALQRARLVRALADL